MSSCVTAAKKKSRLDHFRESEHMELVKPAILEIN